MPRVMNAADIVAAGGAVVAQVDPGLYNIGTNPTTVAAALTSLFGVSNGRGKLYLEGRTYDVGSATLPFTLSDRRVIGVPGSTVITTLAKTLLKMLAASVGEQTDVVFQDITFISTAVDAVDDAVNAVVQFPQSNASRITFIRCGFAALTANINAIKAFCQHAGTGTWDIIFIDCHVIGAGRMGVEVDNTPVNDPTDITTRNFRWKWLGGSIKDTGLVSTTAGQGFSVSGWAEDFEIDTLFDNNMTIAFEGVGVCNSRISGTVTNLRDAAGGVGARAPIALTRNAYLDPSRKMTNNSVVRLIADDGTCGEARLWDQDGLFTEANRWKLSPVTHSGTLTATGSVTYCGSINCKSVADDYDCAGDYALECRDHSSHGGPAANNSWLDLTVDHSRSTTSLSMVLCVGEGTDNNVINGLNYTPQAAATRPAGAEEPLIRSASETLFTASSSTTTLAVTAVASSYEPITAGQTLYGVGVTGGQTILSQLTGTPGGIGTYQLSISQTLSSRSMSTGRAMKNFVRGQVRSSDGFDFVQSTYTLTANADTDLNLVDTAPSLFAGQSLVLASSVTFTATHTIGLPIGFPPTRVTNSITGAQSVILSDNLGGTTVTLATGATVTLASIPTGFSVLP